MNIEMKRRQGSKSVPLFAVVVLGLALTSACGRKTAKDQTPKATDRGTKGVSAGHNGGDAAVRATRQGSSVSGTDTKPLSPQGFRPAYSLIDNHVSAYRIEGGGLVIDCGGPAFAKFVDGGWKSPWLLGRTVHLSGQTVRAALVGGRAGTVTVPVDGLTGPAVLAVELGMWTKGRVTVMVNGKTVQTMPLKIGMNRLHVSVPTGVLHRGDNTIRFVFGKSIVRPGLLGVSGIVTGLGRRKAPANARTAAAFVRIGLGPDGFALSPVDKDPVRFVDSLQHSGAKKAAWRIGPQGVVRYYLSLPERAMLSMSAAALKSGSALDVWVQIDGKPRHKIFSKSLRGAWSPVSVNLPRLDGRAVAVDFVGSRGTVALADLWIDSPVRTPITWARKPIKYVFVWIADTLRRDAVATLGSKDAKTPNFDAFAKHAVVFTQATAPGNHSMPSHASFVTGETPPVHGFEMASRRIPDTVPLVFTLFHKGGWTTGMFSSNGYVSDKWGFNRGLDEYRNFIREKKANAAKYLWGTAKRYLKKVLAKKVFLYLATIDPHVTYDPPTSMLKMYFPGDYHGPVPRRVTGFFLGKIIKGQVKLDSPTDRKYLKSLYLGEVTYNDLWFGNFRKDLQTMGIADQSVVVLVADHGDQFFEHGAVGHGDHLYEEEIAIPLMIWWPGLADHPARFTWDVEACDLLPTLLDLAGLPADPKAQGASLLWLLKMDHEPVMLSALSYNYHRSRSVRIGRYKMIIKAPGRVQVYDLVSDPHEQHNLVKRAPIALRLLRTTFGLNNAYLPLWHKAIWGQASNLKPGFHPVQGRSIR